MSEFSQLRLPMQAAPVERRIGPAALNGGSGMEASGWFDDIVDVAGPLAAKYGPSLVAGLGSLI